MGGRSWIPIRPYYIYQSDVWYSSDGIHWTEATPAAPWHGREGFTAVVYGGKMWLLGGFWQTGWPQFEARPLNDVWYSNMPPPPAAAGRWSRYR